MAGRGVAERGGWSLDVVSANKVRRVHVLGAASAAEARRVVEAQIADGSDPEAVLRAVH